MAKEIINLSSNKIIENDPFKSKLIAIIGIFEGYLSKISKHHFRSIKSDSLDKLTMEELGDIYMRYFKKDTGKHGVCWEYSIYQLINYGDEYTTYLLNDAINTLTEENYIDDLEAILWGGEKGKEIIDIAKENFDEHDLIWTPTKTFLFKDYIELVYTSFHDNKSREILPKQINQIWKTDMFVRKQSSKLWFALNIKWNHYDIKKYSGITIGVCFNENYTLRKNNNLVIYKDKYNNFIDFIKCAIPFPFNFGEYFADSFRLVSNILNNIHRNNNNILNFPRHEENKIFNWFYNNRCYPYMLD